MAASNAQQEPTMEEILASIRRIISEDGDEVAPAQSDEMATEDAIAAIMEAEDVQDEGFDMVDEEPAMAEPEQDAALEPESEFEPESEPELEPEPESEMEPEPETMFEEEIVEDDVLELTDVVEEAVEEHPPVEEQPETILSKQTADLAAQPFSQLSGLLVRNYPGSENTLEGLIREMLRPMLKQWLDENLPAVVERMVAKEIARLTNRD